LADTFMIFRREWPRLILLALALPIGVLLGSFLAQVVVDILREVLTDVSLSPRIEGWVLTLSASVTFMLTTLLIFCGYYKTLLVAARGGKPGVADLFSCLGQVVPVYVAYILISLIIGLGGGLLAFGTLKAVVFLKPYMSQLEYVPLVALFVLPITYALWMSLSLWPFFLLIIDREVGAVEAIGLSFEVTSGDRPQIIVLGIIVLGLLALGLAMLGIGLLVAAPLSMLLITVAYLKMTGQRIAR
jgi:uncharacterized membrane protein